jgi:hypothetical protein
MRTLLCVENADYGVGILSTLARLLEVGQQVNYVKGRDQECSELFELTGNLSESDMFDELYSKYTSMIYKNTATYTHQRSGYQIVYAKTALEPIAYCIVLGLLAVIISSKIWKLVGMLSSRANRSLSLVKSSSSSQHLTKELNLDITYVRRNNRNRCNLQQITAWQVSRLDKIGGIDDVDLEDKANASDETNRADLAIEIYKTVSVTQVEFLSDNDDEIERTNIVDNDSPSDATPSENDADTGTDSASNDDGYNDDFGVTCSSISQDT